MVGHSVSYTLALYAVVVGFTLVSCGKKEDAAAEKDGGNTPAATSTEAPAASDGGSGDAASGAGACALLTNDEASAILGMKTRQDGSDGKSCVIQPGEGVTGMFGGVTIGVVDNRTAFDMMTKIGDPVPGMGDKAILDAGGLGIWKGSKGVLINLINPPTTMDTRAVLMKMGEKIASRI